MLSEHERRECLNALANHPVLEAASSESIERMIRAAQFKKVPPGTLLIREGDVPAAVHFVLRGVTRIFHSVDDGREFTPKILSSPSHFGDVELLSGYACNNQSVETVTEALLAVIDWETVRGVLQTDHNATLGWLAGVAAQFVHTIDADRHNVFVGLEGRVANYLLSIGDVLGERVQKGLRLAVPISREKLANQVGSVKRSVLRVIQGLTQRGLLEEDGTNLVIPSPKELQRQTTLPRRLGISLSLQASNVRGLLDRGHVTK
jgi:CRP-like cAMP-binding protein